MADTDFSQWNPGVANQENDAVYQADSQRSGGAGSGSIFASLLANKAFYQWSTWIRAMALALVNKGYSPKDGTSPYTADTSSNAAVTALAAVFANFITNADLQNSGSPYAGGLVATPTLTDNSHAIPSTAFVKGQNYTAGPVAGLLIQRGNASGTSVTFPTPYSSTPMIALGNFFGSNNIQSASPTGFTLAVAQTTNWIAIGTP